MKKLLMTLGTIGAVALPITAVVACSKSGNEIEKQIKVAEEKASKSLGMLGISDVSQWVSEIVKAYSQPFIKRLDPNGILLNIDQVNGTKYYFEKNENGQQFVSNFQINEDQSWYATIYIIEVPYSKIGMDIKGSIREVSINVTANGKLSWYSENIHAVGSQETVLQNSAIVITKNGAQMITLNSSSYRTEIENLFKSIIDDQTKGASQVQQEIERELNEWGITMFDQQGNSDFLFNSTTRKIVSVSIYAKP